MQDIVNENNRVILDQNSPQPKEGEPEDDNPIIKRRFELKFGKIVIGLPMIPEQDGEVHALWPHEARLRNLTYACPMYLEVDKRVMVARDKPPKDTTVSEEEEGPNEGEGHPSQLYWSREDEPTSREERAQNEARPHIGRLPIMLKSLLCQLRNKTDEELFALDECPFDQGGYFIINGSEKVLIAQERSASNIVQVFKKKQSPTPFVAEIRSAIEKGSRLISSMQVKLYRGAENRDGFGQTIKATLPYIKSDCSYRYRFPRARRCLGRGYPQSYLLRQERYSNAGDAETLYYGSISHSRS